MKIAVSSDWHGMKPEITARHIIDNCDVLLLAGDIFEPSTSNDKLCNYFYYLSENGVKVIMTPGNHDFGIFYGTFPEAKRFRFHKCQTFTKEWLKDELGINCLIDEKIAINGLRIYGLPWTPKFCNWAFNADENGDLIEKTKNIPENIDILISHGPPLDLNSKIDSCCPSLYTGQPEHLGSKCLTDEIIAKKPRFMFCGHIHSGSHDPVIIGETKCWNVSYLGENYSPTYPILTLEI